MNRPPEEFKQIKSEDLYSFATACLQNAGMPSEHAQQLARLLTNSDLRGVRSHGTRALNGYCHTLQERRVNPTPNIQTLKETPTSIMVDGDGGLGYAPTMEVTEKAILKAKEHGMAIGAAAYIGHYGSAGHYVRRAMAADCTAFSVQGAYPQYYTSNKGERAAHYGNPPLCFGLPSQDEPPLVLDGATCILADYQRGEDFIALEEMIPAALFKSMGYTGIGTALGGVFVGQANERAKEIQEQWPAARLGGMIMVIDIGLFVPAADFRNGVDAMVRAAREEMIPLTGYDEATLPGTVEHRNEKNYQHDGIPIALEDLKRLEQVGETFGIAPPWI